jgi:hypothetical protein
MIIHAIAEDTTAVQLISKEDYSCSSRGYNSRPDVHSGQLLYYCGKSNSTAGQMSTAGNSFTTVVKAIALHVRCPQQATPLLL